MNKSQEMPPKPIIIGPFPPPVHGLATTNSAMRDHLQRLGADPKVVDTGATSLDRAVLVRLKRITKVLRGLTRFARMRGLSGGTVYMSVSGGWGQLYETAFIALARLRRMRIFLRHASFAYLDAPSHLIYVLVKIAGPRAVHITQCRRMAKRLSSLYKAKRVIPLSNVVLYSRDQPSSTLWRTRLHTLGFIGNISTEKGVFDFLDLMAAVEAENLPIKAKLAGPFQDARTERAVRVRLEQLKNVEYVGSRYGREKEEFFASIDVFVFPTRYKNETEGKVNHEAMCHGIPVIAYGRGCIPEIVSTDCGRVIDPTAPFVPEALAQIKAWLGDPAAFEAASQAAARRFSKTFAENEQRWQNLLEQILGGDSNGPPSAETQMGKFSSQT